MRHRLEKSENGITLIELLLALALMSIISVSIISYLINGINQFKKVNEEISLHDEANYVMNQFEKQFFVATDVQLSNGECSGSSDCILTLTKMNYDSGMEETITLGFKDQQAVIGGKTIHSPRFRILEPSIIRIDRFSDKKENVVFINMIIEDTQSETELRVELDNRIPFIKVNNESGEEK